jgi:hypothetical protein
MTLSGLSHLLRNQFTHRLPRCALVGDEPSVSAGIGC